MPGLLSTKYPASLRVSLQACLPLAQRAVIVWLCVLLAACNAPPETKPSQLSEDKIVHARAISATPTQFQLPHGESLAARVWSTSAPRHIVLGVHGFNDYSKAFDPLAQHLVSELGATVYAYDQRGFGANPSPGVWRGEDTLLADLRYITLQLRNRYPGIPLTVVGESMGGALVWVAAAEPPGLAADQLVLKAPAVWGVQSMPWYQRISLKLMNALAPDMVFTGRGVKSLGITPTNDPKVARELGLDPLFIKATRVSSLAGVTSLMGRAQNLNTTPNQRTLVLYGLRDRIIPSTPVCVWLQHLNSGTPQSSGLDWLVYPEGWHLLTRQLQTREVLLDLQSWIQQAPLGRRMSTEQAQTVVCAKRP
ncbi:MAG: hypothetical protein RJB14_2264 [Pseudomonadota bacterium]